MNAVLDSTWICLSSDSELANEGKYTNHYILREAQISYQCQKKWKLKAHKNANDHIFPKCSGLVQRFFFLITPYNAFLVAFNSHFSMNLEQITYDYKKKL